MRLTVEQVSMLLSEAAIDWPTGEIDDAITEGLDDIERYSLMDALCPPDGFTFTDPDLIIAMLKERGLA